MVGLSSHLSHKPRLTNLSKSQSLCPERHKCQVPVQVPLVAVFYRLGPGDQTWRKERKRKRVSSISRVMWKTNKAHAQDLYRPWRHRASSQGGLESLGEKVSSVGFHAPKRMKIKRRRWGAQVSSGARVFYYQKCMFYTSSVKWLLIHYKEWNSISCNTVGSLTYTRLLKRVTEESY